MKLIETYATPIWVEDLTELKPHLDGFVRTIRDLRATADEDIRQKSNKLGWHSDLKLLGHPAFAPLKARLNQSVKVAFAQYGINLKDRVCALKGWANVHDRGGYNVNHFHPGSWISGTLYLLVPEGSGRLYFLDPRAGARLEHIPRRKRPDAPPAMTRGKYYIDPAELRLVMFPGWLEHGVEACDTDERISIAFNVTPTQLRKKPKIAKAPAGA